MITSDEFLKLLYDYKDKQFYNKVGNIINRVGYKTNQERELIDTFKNDKDNAQQFLNYCQKLNTNDKVNNTLLAIIFKIVFLKESIDEPKMIEIFNKI